MTQFNQELITKARKGEIAILNDGSVEELIVILKQVWPNDVAPYGLQELSYSFYQAKSFGGFEYRSRNSPPETPTASIKDFFMPDTKTSKQIGISIDTTGFEGDSKTVLADSPRTYKVTRQQMKEIWEVAPCQGAKNKIVEMTTAVFDPFGIEAELNKTEVGMIVDQFDEPLPDLLKLVFTPYFHIPEGEPVLVRRNDCEVWRIYISDGAGGVYIDSYIKAGSCTWKFIIPFTKNPPK